MAADVDPPGALSRKQIFTFWSQQDLKIIPDVIAPIERELAKALEKPTEAPVSSDTPSLRKMIRLYDDSVSFEEANSR